MLVYQSVILLEPDPKNIDEFREALTLSNWGDENKLRSGMSQKTNKDIFPQKSGKKSRNTKTPKTHSLNLLAA